MKAGESQRRRFPPLAQRLSGAEAPAPSPSYRAHGPIARIARLVADDPRLKPIAFGLLPKIGAAETARELENLAETIA